MVHLIYDSSSIKVALYEMHMNYSNYNQVFCLYIFLSLSIDPYFRTQRKLCATQHQIFVMNDGSGATLQKKIWSNESKWENYEKFGWILSTQLFGRWRW